MTFFGVPTNREICGERSERAIIEFCEIKFTERRFAEPSSDFAIFLEKNKKGSIMPRF